jgi:hypothetical protein
MESAIRTIEDIGPDDFVDYTITSVEREMSEDGSRISGWAIGLREVGEDLGGCSFYVDAKHGIQPVVGDLARCYGKGFGSAVRGLALNGVVLYHSTEDVYRARALREMEAYNARRLAEYNAQADERAQALVLLPEIFQERLATMRRNNPNFWQIEGYELFTCQQALVIAEALGSPEAVVAFNELHDWEAQLAMVPDLSPAHSGNTFGTACHLAFLYLQSPEWVLKLHAAMAPLIGSKAAGL